MPLTESDYTTLREVFSYLTPVEITRRAGILTVSQVTRVQSLITTWNLIALKNTRIVATSGEGVDIDPSRQRDLIRNYLAAHLGIGIDYTDNSATSSAALLAGLRISRG